MAHDPSHHAEPATSPRVIERRTDVAVLGGGPAGLAAALQLGRQRRSVVVVDDGRPRNAAAATMHGFLGRDGTAPSTLLADGRREVRSYGGEVLQGRVTRVRRTDDGFALELTGGHRLLARRVVVASGMADELPAVDGLAAQWGRGVVHCPFCHGYEVRDRAVVVLATSPTALHVVGLWRQLTEHLTVLVDPDVTADDALLTTMADAGVVVARGRARRLEVDANDRLVAVVLDDDTRLPADAVAVVARFRVALDPLADLHPRIVAHPSGLGAALDVDGQGHTSVPGVVAVGNVADPSHQVLQAAADGARVGGLLAKELADEDLVAAARPSAHAADWDGRYSGEQLWSGNPNGTLVAEVTSLAPGRALDVGAGEGGDAVWLAEQGWAVTAADVSKAALARVTAAAEARGVTVHPLPADANAHAPFGGATFDLVTAHYASIPRTPDGRGVANLLAAVAPGGTLLVVGHDLAPMRTPIDPAVTSRPFDPDAYVGPDDVAAALADQPEWVLECHTTRPRPAGAASGHHVDDVVLRARRLPDPA